MTFLFVYKPLREGFRPDSLSPLEEIAIKEHFEFLKNHHEQDELYIAGRRVDGEYGFAIVKAEDFAAAVSKSEQDPAVKKGVFRVEVHPFVLALY